MENQEYLSEERYQQSNIKVKKAGKILLIMGIITLAISFILLVIGFVGAGNSAINGFNSFGSTNKFYNTIKENANDPQNAIKEGVDSAQNAMNENTKSAQNMARGIFGNFGLIALSGIMSTIGFGLLITGGIIMFISHRREITAYTTQQVMPVAQEGINKMAPTVGNVAKEIAKGIKEGMKDDES